MSVDPEATPTGNSADAALDNWEQRYKDTQAAYTQSQQELAALRKLANGEDPEGFQQLLDRMGYEVDDDQEDPGEPVEDPDEYVEDGGEMYAEDDPRWAQVEQYIAGQEEEKYNQIRAQDWQGWDSYVRNQAQSQGVELTDREMKAMVADCIGEDGFPVPQAAADAVLKQHLEWRTEFAQQLQPPKRPRAPHVPGGGSPADGDPGVDLSTREGRNQHMLARLQAENG